jgi:hypothetical protein
MGIIFIIKQQVSTIESTKMSASECHLILPNRSSKTKALFTIFPKVSREKRRIAYYTYVLNHLNAD